MRDLSSGCKQSFFRLKIFFAPYSEEIEPALLGMSLTTRRGTSTQISFLVFESRSCENFVLAQFSIGWSENWQLNKTRALFDQLFLFLARKLKNELLTVVPGSLKISQLRLSRSGKLVWVPLRAYGAQTHSEKSRLHFLTLRGKNYCM